MSSEVGKTRDRRVDDAFNARDGVSPLTTERLGRITARSDDEHRSDHPQRWSLAPSSQR